MLTLPQLFFLMLFGAFGTLSRYLLSSYINKFFTYPYLWGTSLVNILGCFIFAFIYVLSHKFPISEATRTICLTGFLGAFTTFSALMFETHSLLSENILIACGYLGIQIFFGVFAFYLAFFFFKP